jgi:FtsH-binding integral membrane protein
MGDINNDKEFLLNEYSFMQKTYELQFNHFMNVFYFWTVIITVPTGAGIIANLGVANSSNPKVFGFLCLFVSMIGFFLSTKMFDIRRSQIRYLERTNEFRIALWEKYKIEKLTKIKPMGKGVNLVDVAKKDFGMHMAWVMSLIHGVIFSVGVLYILKNSLSLAIVIVICSLLGLCLFFVNLKIYFKFITKKVKVT